jgi:thioredoxin 1
MKLLTTLTTCGILLLSLFANAKFKDFSKSKYESAIKSGSTIVLDFHASWCPTCKKQEPILNEIVSMKGYENVVALKANYDEEKELKKSLKVTKQSTVIVFKSGKEVARSTGVTSKDELKKLIDSGL